MIILIYRPLVHLLVICTVLLSNKNQAQRLLDLLAAATPCFGTAQEMRCQRLNMWEESNNVRMRKLLTKSEENMWVVKEKAVRRKMLGVSTDNQTLR